MWESLKYILKVRILRKLERDLIDQTAVRAKSKKKSINIQKELEDTKKQLNDMKAY